MAREAYGVLSSRGGGDVIDHVNNLKLQHLVELSKLGDGCAALEARIDRWLSENDVVFAGHTIPFVLMPHFVSPGQLRRVKRAVACLSGVLDRFCDAYAEDERLRDELAVPAREDALIRLDPGYPRPLRICRLDAFLQGYDVKFLEFNADSPAGAGPWVREFGIVCAAARAAGIEALHATLGEVEYDGSLRRVQGEPVHLV